MRKESDDTKHTHVADWIFVLIGRNIICIGSGKYDNKKRVKKVFRHFQIVFYVVLIYLFS